MLWNAIARLVREDEGMEMVEWSIVGVVFALAAALLWGSLRGNINSALTDIGECVAGTDCTAPAAGGGGGGATP